MVATKSQPGEHPTGFCSDLLTGRLDPLRDDGTRYVDLLTGAGIDAVLLDHPMTHGLSAPAATATSLREVTDFGAKHLV